MKMGFQDNWIDRVGMAAIVLVSLGYVLFGGSFAQLRLEFLFLNFPIFIGEILLGFTSLLFIVKCARQKQGLGRWVWILGAYLFFVLFKAFSGYFAWGPLAFRDAALFYYPFFAILGYSFWSHDLWGHKTRRWFFALILCIFIFYQFVGYWPCSLIIICLILALQAKSFQERMILIGAIFLFAPYGDLFDVFLRSIFLSWMITVFIIGVIFFLLFYKNWRACIAGGVLWGLILGTGFFNIIQSGMLNTCDIKGAKSLSIPLTQELPREKRLAQPVIEENKPVVVGNKPVVELAAVPLIQVPPVTQAPPVTQTPPVTQSFPRKECLFQPVGRTSKKPDSIKEFLQRINRGDFFMGKKHVVEINNNTLRIKRDDTLFRYYIWRDMAFEYARYKPLFGFDFGRPLYSPSLLKDFGASTPQDRDGWVGAHNSFFYMIYRAGIIGLVMILFVFVLWFRLIRDFYIFRDWTGILLCAILLNWFVLANFFLIFELPYTAIPVWTILGITAKHRMLLKNRN